MRWFVPSLWELHTHAPIGTQAKASEDLSSDALPPSLAPLAALNAIDLCLSKLRGRPQGQLEFLGVGWDGEREQREWRRKNNSK